MEKTTFTDNQILNILTQAENGVPVPKLWRGKPKSIRYDWLSHYIYNDITELQNKTTRWLSTYNHKRPNMGIGGITPIQKLKLIQQQNSTPNFH